MSNIIKTITNQSSLQELQEGGQNDQCGPTGRDQDGRNQDTDRLIRNQRSQNERQESGADDDDVATDGAGRLLEYRVTRLGPAAFPLSKSSRASQEVDGVVDCETQAQ